MESSDAGTLLFSWRGCLFRVRDQVQSPKAGSHFFCRHLVVHPGERVLEIGGGLGLAAVLAARSGARVTATDVLPEAVEVMRANATLNDVTVDARLGGCYAPVDGGRFDLHCTNPPQMLTPPGRARRDAAAAADNGGTDGWDLLDRVIAGATRHLEPGGRLIFTIFRIPRTKDRAREGRGGGSHARHCREGGPIIPTDRIRAPRSHPRPRSGGHGAVRDAGSGRAVRDPGERPEVTRR